MVHKCIILSQEPFHVTMPIFGRFSKRGNENRFPWIAAAKPRFIYFEAGAHCFVSPVSIRYYYIFFVSFPPLSNESNQNRIMLSEHNARTSNVRLSQNQKYK